MYLFVTWAVSSLFYFLIIKSAGINAASGAYTAGLMWRPAIPTLLTCNYLARPIASLGSQWCQTRYQVQAGAVRERVQARVGSLRTGGDDGE